MKKQEILPIVVMNLLLSSFCTYTIISEWYRGYSKFTYFGSMNPEDSLVIKLITTVLIALIIDYIVYTKLYKGRISVILFDVSVLISLVAGQYFYGILISLYWFIEPRIMYLTIFVAGTYVIVSLYKIMKNIKTKMYRRD